MTQGTPAISAPFGDAVRERIADALGIAHEEICREYPVAVASTGHSKVMVPLYSNELLHGLQPDLQKLTKISKQIECNGYYAFTLNPQRILVHGRMFAPAIGIAEDPVTGNANGPLGAYLVHFNILQDEDARCFDFDILQEKRSNGMEQCTFMLKKSTDAEAGSNYRNAVIAFSTEITI